MRRIIILFVALWWVTCGTAPFEPELATTCDTAYCVVLPPTCFNYKDSGLVCGNTVDTVVTCDTL